VLNLSLGQDTGGQQMRLQDAWPLYYPEDEYTSVTSTPTFYPIKHRYNLSILKNELWPKADVVHLNNDLRYIERFRKMLDPNGKRLIIHHHGTMFRTALKYHLDAIRQYRATAIVSTVDLWALAPEHTTWQPQTYQLHELQSYRVPNETDTIRISHAPTNRGIKSTVALIAAVDRLKKEGANVELDVIERRSNVECLRRKGRSDIYVDQLFLGYGCNAIEAWGMGLPVVAGIDPERCSQIVRQHISPDTRDRALEQWGSIPYIESSETELYAVLSKLIQSKSLRTRWANKGMKHFMLHHEAEASIPRLRQLYDSVSN
jgi:hypothetical protein